MRSDYRSPPRRRIAIGAAANLSGLGEGGHDLEGSEFKDRDCGMPEVKFSAARYRAPEAALAETRVNLDRQPTAGDVLAAIRAAAAGSGGRRAVVSSGGAPLSSSVNAGR